MNGNRLILGVMLLAGSVGMAIYGLSDIRDALHGQQTVPLSALSGASVATPLAHPWVSFDAVTVADTGVSLTSSGDEQRKFLAIDVSGKWLLAVVPTGFSGTHFAGAVRPWRYTKYLEAKDAIVSHLPAGAAVMDVQLDAFASPVSNAWATGGIAAALAVMGLLLLLWHPAPPGSSSSARRPRA